MREKIKLFLLIMVMLFACGNTNMVNALNFSNISQLIFFGDSLTDGGFNDLWPTQGVPGEPLPVGKAPTFTTFGGYTWAQYLANQIKGFPLPVYPGPSVPDTITNNAIYAVPDFVSGTLTGINYAAAGSTTDSTGFSETWAPSLHQQVAFYLQSLGSNQSLDPNAIYFIWSGANDFLAALSEPTFPTELDLLNTANTAANNIANEVALLSSRGAKRIVVMSLPNFGLSPFASRLNIPGAQGSLKTLSFTFNSMLNTQLGRVIQQYGTNILFVDIYTLLENAINATIAGNQFIVAGQSFQFANATDPACSTVISSIYCPSTAPSNYIFADFLHPTDMSHQVIALYVKTLLQSWK